MRSDKFSKIIGNNICRIRKEKGIKGETLAKELHVSKAAISQMENGYVNFKISTLTNIASLLQTNISSLLEEDFCLEFEFADFRFKTEQHLKTINMLVCRIEYMNEQIESMRMRKVS